jgi:hypothetical protein
LATQSAFADQPPFSNRFYNSGDDLSIELVTIGPGDEIQNYFGHNAMIVTDTRRRFAILYNFGAFDFNREVAWEYIKGRLRFWVSTSWVRSTYDRYTAMNRSIRVQELNLSSAQRLFIAEKLANNALPNNRYYLYHHFYDNCSTRLRDLIDSAIGGQLKSAYSDPARFNFREHTRRFTGRYFLADVMINFIMNDQVDQPITRSEEAFLPSELEKQVSKMNYLTEDRGRVPLVKRAYTVYSAKRSPIADRPPCTWPYSLLLGLFIGALALGLALLSIRATKSLPRILFGVHHVFVGIAFGLPGSILFFMSNFTDHFVTARNENLFLANPVTLLVFPLGFFIICGRRWAYKWARYLFYLLTFGSCFALTAKLFPDFDQDNFAHISLILPVTLGFTAAHFLLARESPKRA